MDYNLDALLYVACCSNDTEQIGALVSEHHAGIDVCIILTCLQNANRQREREPTETHRDLIEESSVELVLRNFQPYANAKWIDDIFSHICYQQTPISIVCTFLELYACELTVETVCRNLCSKVIGATTIASIIEACMEKLTPDAYWVGFRACCQEQRTELLEKMIGHYHYVALGPAYDATDVLGMSLEVCCESNDTKTIRLILKEYDTKACQWIPFICSLVAKPDILQMIFDDYLELLTLNAVKAGFDVACSSQKIEMIGMYISNSKKFSQVPVSCARERFNQIPDFISPCLQEWYIQAIDDAVRFDCSDVVEVLLASCQDLLKFGSSHIFTYRGAKPSEELVRVLRAAYGSRLVVCKSGWIGLRAP